ncbi:MAG: zinc ABC transporter substrate-binding protein [Desulfobacteraceae bacterium]
MRRLCLNIGFFLFSLVVASPTFGIGAEPVPVFVSIVPQKYFAQKIGGELIKVSVMVKPGASPATYEPKPNQMVALSKAKIYCAIGVPFERVWLKKISAANPKMLIVHTEKGIEKRPMKAHHHEEGNHKTLEKGRQGPADEHQGIMDPHIWLSPPLVKIQARNILNALLLVDPRHGSIYESNYNKFIVELDALDAHIRGVFAGKGERVAFMVFHPAWGYFAQTYGLHQIAVEIEGKEPRPADLKHLIHDAEERGIKVIFVQPEFSTKSAKAIARAIGGQVVLANPLAPDWASNLKEMASKFKAALR